QTGRQVTTAPAATGVQGRCPWRGRFLVPRRAAEGGPGTRKRALCDTGTPYQRTAQPQSHYQTAPGRARACKALRSGSAATHRYAARPRQGWRRAPDSATLQEHERREGESDDDTEAGSSPAAARPLAGAEKGAGGED